MVHQDETQKSSDVLYTPGAFPDPALDYRRHPEAYRIGRGEQGVLMVQPYKSELLPLWRFKTPEIARASAEALYDRFVAYRDAGDFVGMDMARKYLQMGYTRARRYGWHRSGRKFDADGNLLPNDIDPIKQASAQVFREYWDRVRADAVYQGARARHRRECEKAL